MEALLDRKMEIEDRIFALCDELGENKDIPLVDAQGYPREDVDHYSARIGKNELSALHAELRDIMRAIETELPQAMAAGRKYSTAPFAVLERIEAGGLAEAVGLQANDKLVRLNDVTRYEDLAALSLADAADVHIKVLRGFKMLALTGKPAGSHRLGAHLHKISAADKSKA